MTERVDLGAVAFAADERVVLRHGTVVVQAQDLAGQRGRVLRVAASRRHVQLAVAAEYEARDRTGIRRGDEQVARADELFAVPPAARERERAFVVR